MATASLPKELANRLIKTVPFLKRWAANPTLNAYQVAQGTGIAQSTLYQAIIPEFLNIYHAASKQQDFPSNILIYYNQHGNPDPNLNLTDAEVHALKPVFEREMARKPEQMQQAYYSNPPQQAFEAAEQRQQTRNLGTNATLISYIMERIRLAPIGQIKKFVELFEMKEDYYMTHPEILKELFKSQFGPLPGEMGFQHFMLSQPSYVYQGNQAQAAGGYPFQTGFAPGSPMGMAMPTTGFGMSGMGMPNMGMGMPGMGMDPMHYQMYWQQMQEEQKEERRMRHQQNIMAQMTNATMTNMMQRSMEAKQPLGGEALMMGDVEEQYDAEGNLTGRKILRRTGGDGSNTNMQYIMKLYELQLQKEREEKLAVINKADKPSELLSGVFKTMLENQLKMNPFEFVKGIKEMGQDIFGGNTKTRETIDADRDWQLSLMREDLEIAKIKHDWSAQDRANAESKEHMEGFISGLGSLVKDVAVPKLNKFIDGMTGQMAPGQQRGPPQQGAQGPPQGQGQIRLPQLAPGYRWVQTPQGLAVARVPTAQEAMAGGQPGMGMPGAEPGSFEESEEIRMQKTVQNLNNFAHQLQHKENAMKEWEAQLAKREQDAGAAGQYAENKIRQANEVLRNNQFQQEQRSFEEFTKEELTAYYQNIAKKMDEIKKAVTQKNKEELEAQARDAAQNDTTPMAVNESDMYQGEYEEDRDKLLAETQEPDPDSAVPSNAGHDSEQNTGPA